MVGAEKEVLKPAGVKSTEEKREGKELVTKVVETEIKEVDKEPEEEEEVDEKIVEQIKAIKKATIVQLEDIAEALKVDVSSCKKKADKQAYLIEVVSKG